MRVIFLPLYYSCTGRIVQRLTVVGLFYCGDWLNSSVIYYISFVEAVTHNKNKTIYKKGTMVKHDGCKRSKCKDRVV